MWTLAVETSGRVASLAFLKDDRCVLIRSLDESGRRHARTLVASVRGCCRELGIIPAELGLIVVSEGPGSFTGLRVGVVFAKVLAFTHQIPLAAVNTLTVIAAGQAKVSGAIWPLIDAQRGDVFTARHEFQSDGRCCPSEPVRIISWNKLTNEVGSEDLLTGPALERFRENVRPEFQIAESDCWCPSAERLGFLGLRKMEGNELVDPIKLVPFYLRPSAAEEKWNSQYP